MSIPEQCWVYYNAGISQGIQQSQQYQIFSMFIILGVILAYSFFILRPILKSKENKKK